jgi:predicted nucleic-acid-binding protein
LHLTDVVVAETAFVLRSIYHYRREDIVDALIELVLRHNIVPFDLDKGTMIDALLLCRPSGRVSFADAMIWTAARKVQNGVVYTFDRRFPSDGITVRHSV